MPSWLIRARISKMVRTMTGARPRLGSSSMSRRGRAMRPRPIAHICCSPPTASPRAARWRSASSGKSWKTQSSVVRRTVRAAAERHPSSRFSSTVMVGKSWRPSGTWAIPRPTIAADREPVEARAVQLDHAAADGEQPGDRPERRRLAGAVAADQRHRLSRAHLERHVGHRDEIAVGRLDPLKPEERGHTRRRGRPRPLSGDWRRRRAALPRSSRRRRSPRCGATATSPRAYCAR